MRRRVIPIGDSELENLDEKIAVCKLGKQQKKTVEKDLHLVRAAILTDETIFSQDRQVCTLLAKASLEIVELRHIIWIDANDEFMVDWVQYNALFARVADRTLEAFAAKSLT